MADTIGNRLLQSCSSDLRASLLNNAERVHLDRQTMLHGRGDMPKFCYFLTDGLASSVVSMRAGGSAEVAMIGTDGVVGGFSLLGDLSPSNETFMQISGEGFRVPRQVICEHFLSSDEFRSRVLRWIQSVLYTSLQTSACGLLHEAEARLARWLLMSSDRAESNDMDLTQEFLAQMLGTQRTTVALVAGHLRDRGLIDYSRGKVRILNRPGLTDAACECYSISRRGILHLYPDHA